MGGVRRGGGLPADVLEELERIFAPFEGRAFLDTGGHNETNLLTVAARRGLVSSGGYLLTGRIDDDDAWDRRTVSTVRERLGAWLAKKDGAPGFALTFENGLVWVMYDMMDVARMQEHGETVVHRASVKPFSHPFTSISGFVYSPLSEGLTSISTGHSRIPDLAQEHGFAVERLVAERPMWLYCRHKQTTSVIGRALEAEAMDLTLAQLRDRFGIDEEEVALYIQNAVRYDYSWVGHWQNRHRLQAQLRAVGEKCFAEETSESERAALQVERLRLQEEFEKACENVMFRLNGEDPATTG